MNNPIFDIEGLGKLKFLVSVLDLDYPRTFVCKKEGRDNIELFLLDEYNHGDDYVEWLCVQISIDDLDRLNRGFITLESCFFGPRRSKKPGYKITSKAGQEKASCISLDEVGATLVDNNTYAEEFLEDDHGANLMSLVYGKPILAFVLKPEEFADPMIDSSYLGKSSNAYNSTIKAMPFLVKSQKNRMCYSANHSLVAYYEIEDQEITKAGKQDNSEAHDVLNAFRTFLDEKSSEVEVLDAFRGDKLSIQKMSSLITTLKKGDSIKKVEVLISDQSNENGAKPIQAKSEISNDTLEIVKERNRKAIDIINSPDRHIIEEFCKEGQFLMLDTTGRKRFKFQSTEKMDDGIIYSGFSEAVLNGFVVDSKGDSRYRVKIRSDLLKTDSGKSKPVYTLLEIVETIKRPEQLALI